MFYPESSPERCTVALLLDVDPVGLVRGRGSTLGQYVNDRPYAASSEGAVHTGRDHRWHLETLTKLCREDDVLLETSHLEADTTDPQDEERVVAWWEELTGPGRGGEGMVVKPLDFVARGRRGIAQPGVKCRGREYLRLVYGPEYTAPANLQRLRQRNLSAKRSLALREFALGVEALERFVRRDPLYRVHECVFGVLALESEPVDPRL